MLTLFLVMANASHFVRTQSGTPRTILVEIAAVSLAICITNFAVGRFLGGRRHGPEASQSLGQKNTSFTLWIALAYASPLVALGPACYILWHNLWNGWQLHRVSRPRNLPRPDPKVTQ
jgi:bile acid:Na+ symporter, BASS family